LGPNMKLLFGQLAIGNQPTAFSGGDS
jgi:hypothetical protein